MALDANPKSTRTIALRVPTDEVAWVRLDNDVYVADLLVRHVSLTPDRWSELIMQSKFVPFAVIEIDCSLTSRRADRLAAAAARLGGGAWIRTNHLGPGRRAKWSGTHVAERVATALPLRFWQIVTLALVGASATVAATLVGGTFGDVLGPAGSVVLGLAVVFGVEHKVLQRDRLRRSARAASTVLSRASNAARLYGRQLSRQLHSPESVLDSVASEVFDYQQSRAGKPGAGLMTIGQLRAANSYRRHLHHLRQADHAHYIEFVKDPRGGTARISWGEGQVEDLRVLGRYARGQASAVADLSDLSRDAAELLEQPDLLVQSLGLGETAVTLGALADNIDAYLSLPANSEDARRARHALRITPGHDDAAMPSSSAEEANPEEALQWISGELLDLAFQSWSQTVDIVRVAIAEHKGVSEDDRRSTVRNPGAEPEPEASAIDLRFPLDHHAAGGSRPALSSDWLRERERAAGAEWTACSFRSVCRGATLDGRCLSCLALTSPEIVRNRLLKCPDGTIDLRGARMTIQLVDLLRDVFADGCDARLEFSWTTWPQYADLSHLELRGGVDMQNAVIPSWVSFHGTVFTRSNFRSAEFGPFVSFARARFQGTTIFRDAFMAAGTTFAGATLTDDIDIHGIRGETREITNFAKSQRPAHSPAI